MKNEESNRIIKMEIIAIKLYNWLSPRSPNSVSSLFVLHSSFKLRFMFLYAKEISSEYCIFAPFI